MEVRIDSYKCGQDLILIPLKYYQEPENYIFLFLAINTFFPTFFGEEDPLLIPVKNLVEVHAINKKASKIMFKNSQQFFQELS